MNCQEFENVIIELARSQMMDAAVRENGLAHLEACLRCAARLRDEQALTAGLRALAATTESEGAPLQVEAALRSAFREPRQQVAANERAVARAAMAFIPPSTQLRRWRRWAIAAAAVILVMLALMAQGWLRASSPDHDQRVTIAPPPLPSPTLSRREPSPEMVTPERKPQIVQDHKRPRRRINDAKSGSTPLGNVAAEAHEVEIVTDFFPLTNDSDLTRLEGGQVLRVRMPRSALLTFGLPMNIDRASEPVKADVVVSHDGLARAVRFVH